MHALYLRLLKHDFRYQYIVRICCAPPGKITTMMFVVLIDLPLKCPYFLCGENFSFHC